MRIAITTAACLVSCSALGQTTREFVETDSNGMRIVRTTSGLGSDSQQGPGFEEVLLWTYVDADSIPYSVALGDAGSEAWVAHSLNDERISKFDTAGGGVPDFVYSMLAENPSTVGVAAASDASLCASISRSDTDQITARAFTNAGGNAPVWAYAFAASYTNVSPSSVAVNADGSRVALTAYDGANTLLVLLDGSGGVLGTATIAGFSLRIDMDDSGERILVTAGSVARLYEAATMTNTYSLAVSGAGGFFHISRDGTAIAAGGFNVKAAREIGGVWQEVYSANGSQDWFGGVSLSGDGSTMFALSHNYGDGYLTAKHRVVDLLTSTVVASSQYTGSGGLQNTAVASESNEDGTVFVAASWGDAGNTQPEVRVYDRDLNLIDSLDTAGSPFSLDMSPDGKYVLVGSKSVHANTNGRGGHTQLLSLARDCVADVNGDGALTAADFTAWIAAFNAGAPECDQNGDGSCTPADFTAWIANFNAGC